MFKKMEKYTIKFSVFREGNMTKIVDKDNVRSECERLKNLQIHVDNINKENGRTQTYCIIEVLNNNTGEIREYWNNHDNKIKF